MWISENFNCAFLLIITGISSAVAGESKKITIDWHNVGTKKNKLIRREITLKRSRMGEPAQLCAPCDQEIWDACLWPIYGDSELSIYERSDLLFNHIRDVQNMFKNASAVSTCPGLGNTSVRFEWKDVCGANHLMACIFGQCRCMGEAPDEYPKYKSLKETIFRDPDDPDLIYRECRVKEEDAICNVHSYLFCDGSPESDPQLRCVTSGNRCRCQVADPNNPDHFEHELPSDESFGLDIPKIPKDDCHPMVRMRLREYQ